MKQMESTILSSTGQPDDHAFRRDCLRAGDGTENLRRLAPNLMLADQRDRRRLARAMHDEISQPLAMAMMLLGFMQKSPTPEGKAVLTDQADGIKRVRELLSQAIERSRSIASELSPALLYELGLAPALEGLTEQIRRQHGLNVVVQGTLSGEAISTDVQVLLYQAVIELLNNVVRHAQARNAWVTLATEQLEGEPVVHGIRIEIRDDGVGFDAEAARHTDSGLGLLNVRTMLDHAGCCFTLTSRTGSGTTAQIFAPLTNSPETGINSHNHRRPL